MKRSLQDRLIDVMVALVCLAAPISIAAMVLWPPTAPSHNISSPVVILTDDKGYEVMSVEYMGETFLYARPTGSTQ